jgi:hypothetical protein
VRRAFAKILAIQILAYLLSGESARLSSESAVNGFAAVERDVARVVTVGWPVELHLTVNVSKLFKDKGHRTGG